MAEVFEADSTVEQWDQDYYHPIALKLYDWAIQDMLKMMGVTEGATVLDAGCGPGVHSIRVAKAGYRVYAIDLSNAMLSQAEQRVAAANVAESVQFQRQDLTQLDFPDRSFRYVFSWGVIIHIPDVEKALDELARMIDSGGQLALYITNKSALDHKIEAFLRWVLKKPLADLQHLPLGDGIWYTLNGEKLWVWRLDAGAVANYLAQRGFVLKHRRIGELSEFQRRLQGIPRSLLLHLNNLAYRWQLPAAWAASQLLIFEKR